LMPCNLAMSCKCLRGVAARFTFCTHDGTLIFQTARDLVDREVEGEGKGEGRGGG
jgi:hypothetical protein